MIKIVMLLLAIAICAGCSRIVEDIQRGPKNSPEYIAPDYRKVTVILYDPKLVEETKQGIFVWRAYTVVEDDRGRRYRIYGKVGELGEEFEMDVSLKEEIK